MHLTKHYIARVVESYIFTFLIAEKFTILD